MRSIRVFANNAAQLFQAPHEITSYFHSTHVTIPGIGLQTEIDISEDIDTLDLNARVISSEGAKVIAELLKHDRCKNIETIILSNNLLRDQDVELIVDAIKQAGLAELRLIAFDNNLIHAPGVTSVLSLLHRPQSKRKFEIDLSDIKFGDKGIRALADVLQQPGCPPKTRLGFNRVGMKVSGAKMLFKAAESPHCPKGLKLWLDGNLGKTFWVQKIKERIDLNGVLYIPTRSGFRLPLSIIPYKKWRLNELKDVALGIEGAQVLATALEMDCYRGLEMLNLSNTDLDDDSLICILQALQRADRKMLNVLYLDGNKITDKGLTAIADAISAGVFVAGREKVFASCTISLCGNAFTNNGINELRRGLTHPACPNDLEVRLATENIDNRAAKAIIHMYRSGLCKEELKMDVGSCWNITDKAKRRIERARLKNQVRYHAERSLALYQGLQQADSPLSILNKNRDCMTLITPHMLPKLDDYTSSLRKEYANRKTVFARNVHTFYKNMEAKRQQAAMPVEQNNLVCK